MEETDKGRNLIKAGKSGLPKHQVLDFSPFACWLDGGGFCPAQTLDTHPVISKSEPAVPQMAAGFSVCCPFFPSDLSFFFFFLREQKVLIQNMLLAYESFLRNSEVPLFLDQCFHLQ